MAIDHSELPEAKAELTLDELRRLAEQPWFEELAKFHACEWHHDYILLVAKFLRMKAALIEAEGVARNIEDGKIQARRDAAVKSLGLKLTGEPS